MYKKIITLILSIILLGACAKTGETSLTIQQCDEYLEQCERAFYGSPQLGQCTRIWKECRQTGIWRN